jgi:hypothetical protein
MAIGSGGQTGAPNLAQKQHCVRETSRMSIKQVLPEALSALGISVRGQLKNQTIGIAFRIRI